MRHVALDNDEGEGGHFALSPPLVRIRSFAFSYSGCEGKPAKVALTACMRKFLTILNAMVRHHTHWRVAAA